MLIRQKYISIEATSVIWSGSRIFYFKEYIFFIEYFYGNFFFIDITLHFFQMSLRMLHEFDWTIEERNIYNTYMGSNDPNPTEIPKCFIIHQYKLLQKKDLFENMPPHSATRCNF